MRPIKLTMQAFGPFLSETVDFDAFGDHLFLISGATGSGKTTIFDGICYALYGEASGDDRLPDGMKSDFAPVGTACVVTLVFDVRGTVYRIRRMPHQQMYNSHNTGLKEQKHEAELWQIEEDGSEKLLCSNITDIKNKVHEILGLTASQFRQIVMLPQGRFSRLLKANEKERVDLLKTLFPMTFYKNFEKRLEREAKDAESEFNALADQLKRKREDFIPKESSTLAEILLADETPVPLVLSAAESQNKKDKQGVDGLTDAIKAENEKLEMLNMAIGAGEAQIARFDKMDELTGKLKDLTSREQEMKSLAEWVDVAQRVEKVGPFEKILIKERTREKHAVERLNEAKKNCQKAQSRWEALQPEINAVSDDGFNKALNDNRKLEEKIKDQQKALDELAVHSEKRSHLKDEVKAIKTKVDQLTAAEKEQKKMTGERIALTERITEMEREKIQVERAQTVLTQTEKAAATIAESLSNHAECKQTIGKIQDQITNLRQQIQETEIALEQAKAIDKDNRAAALAAELKSGEPCPVCGSVHHPNPAANNNQNGKAGDINVLTDRLTALTAELKGAETKEEMTGKEMKTHLKSAERELVEARKADGSFSKTVSSDPLKYDADAAMASLEDRKTLLCRQLKGLTTDLEQYAEQKKTMDSRLMELEQMIVSHSGYREKLEAKSEAYQKEFGVCHSLAEGLKAIDIVISKPSDIQAAKESLAEKRSAATREVANAEKRQKQLAEAVTQIKSELSATEAKQSAAEQNLRESKKAAAQAKEVFEHELKQASLSREQYDANQSIDGEKIRTNQKMLEDYQRELVSATDNLTALKEELAGKTKPDLEDLKVKKENELAEIDRRRQELKETENRLNINRQAASDLKSLYKAYQDAESRFGLLNGLNKTVKGTVPGKQKMSFERYILSAYLSDVLERANLFLEMISDGRYRLELSGETGSKQNRGLAIAVFDEYTGKARNASSLSGGETFMAALSMALGLSDMVSEQKGALTIDTLFIDEGFATLDAEAREKAMTCLARLRRQGRSVGIISHVSELIDLIDDKIIVTKTDEGSHIRLVQ
ncbi:MAG: AAA family ATPase [Eubacteriaceae bacterium]|nr:AAA family ATPase [Eubacteriaceae bacterium]